MDDLGTHVSELIEGLMSQPMFGSGDWAFTQYFFWMLVALITMLALVFVGKKKMSIIPEGRFINAFEFLVEFGRNNLARSVIANNPDKHIPFLLTLFLFILINNLWGMVPGAKPGTGTTGVTAALATVSFVYFVYCGMQERGVLGYIKSLAPSGLPFPLNILIWFIELFSTLFRLLTLTVRLFAAMFAGHVALGILCILTSVMVQPLIENFTMGNVAGALPAIFSLFLLVFMYAIELLIAVVQAYVFAVLSSVYIDLATSAH